MGFLSSIKSLLRLGSRYDFLKKKKMTSTCVLLSFVNTKDCSPDGFEQLEREENTLPNGFEQLNVKISLLHHSRMDLNNWNLKRRLFLLFRMDLSSLNVKRSLLHRSRMDLST
jgi:hypothetical protein